LQPLDTSAKDLDKLKESLRAFGERLSAALGENLISVVLFGGAARGRFHPVTSDVNLMLVLREASTTALDRIAAAAEPVRLDYTLSLLTVTEADLGDSAEVFPTKFLDMQRHHETLFGQEVTRDLHVPQDRLRRQAVRQLMNLHLRLRQTYLDSRGRPEALDRAIRRSVSTLLLGLGVVLELRSGEPCETTEELFTAAGAAGLDRAQLASFVEFKQGRHEVPPGEIRLYYERFAAFVEATLRLAGPV